MANNKLDTEKRIYVKIRFNKNGTYPGLGETVYYRNAMTINFFHRWKWFFQYREALIRVKFPRCFVELTYGPYDYVLPEEEYKKKIKNILIAAKRNLTAADNKIEYVKQNWNELFPVEEHPQWKSVMEKKDKYNQKIEEFTKEYESLCAGTTNNKPSETASYYKELFNIDYINIKVF